MLSCDENVFPVVCRGLDMLGLQEDVELPPRIDARHATSARGGVIAGWRVEEEVALKLVQYMLGLLLALETTMRNGQSAWRRGNPNRFEGGVRWRVEAIGWEGCCSG